MAVNPGPLWANPNAATKETVMYAQSLALYDCFLREHTNDRASRGGTPSDWVFYGDVDEVFVAPLVEARRASDLKALMATAPNATKYLVHNSVITVFERRGPAMALAARAGRGHARHQVRRVERDILNGFAVDAAAAALRNLGPTLTPIYDCWRRRLHGQRYAASKSLINFFFVVDGAAPCANETEPPPWRPGRSRY
ncbi:hypothetical protein JL722_13436 [Aureococcus anophagefferens]|nr:hypothetical protein JL722_13436 [Aureococcus anophagefferens]